MPDELFSGIPALRYDFLNLYQTLGRDEGRVRFLIRKSVVDTHPFDADPDLDPTFHSDADPDPDPNLT